VARGARLLARVVLDLDLWEARRPRHVRGVAAGAEDPAVRALRLLLDGVARVGGEGAVAYAEGMAVIKGAPNKENARKFMDWATGLEARKLVLSQFLRRPAREDVDFATLAPGMVPLSKIKMLKSYDQDYWIKKQPEVLQKVKDILLRVK